MNDVKMVHGKKAENIPGFLLWQLSKVWQRQLEKAFKDLNLSHTQGILLGNIVRFHNEDKHVSQKLLSTATRVDPMTVSQVIQTLEKKHLVKRTTSANDRRSYHVVPTPQGILLTNKALQRLPTIHKAFFQPLTEQELDSLRYILRTLLEAHKTE